MKALLSESLGKLLKEQHGRRAFQSAIQLALVQGGASTVVVAGDAAAAKPDREIKVRLVPVRD